MLFCIRITLISVNRLTLFILAAKLSFKKYCLPLKMGGRNVGVNMPKDLRFAIKMDGRFAFILNLVTLPISGSNYYQNISINWDSINISSLLEDLGKELQLQSTKSLN